MINEFLKTTIEDEISASGLFSISDSAEYELSGKINSLKNAHVEGNSSKLARLVINAGTIFEVGYLLVTNSNGGFSVAGALLPLLLIDGAGILISSTNSDHITTVISYDVTLRKKGIEVWRKGINVVIQERLYTGGKGSQKISSESSIILDKAITRAVKKLLEQLNENLK